MPHTQSNDPPACRIQPNVVGWSHHIHPETQMRFKSINAHWLQRGENWNYHPAEEQQASLGREGERKVFSHPAAAKPTIHGNILIILWERKNLTLPKHTCSDCSQV